MIEVKVNKPSFAQTNDIGDLNFQRQVAANRLSSITPLIPF